MTFSVFFFTSGSNLDGIKSFILSHMSEKYILVKICV